MEEIPSKEAIASSYQLIRRQPPWSLPNTGISHHRVLPFATYAPWLDNQEFLKIYSKIKDHTLVDIYRCYELWEMARQSLKFGGSFLEVGVWRGGTGALLTSVMESISKDRNERVYLADTFSGVVKADEYVDPLYRGGEHADTSALHVDSLMAELDLTRYELLQGIFPDQTATLIHHPAPEKMKFSFCHIDVDVYKSAHDVFFWIEQHLSVGACVVFDDYGFAGTEGVTVFCNQLKARKGFVWSHNLNGHFIMFKVKI
jgi:O-methyltransferase